MSGTESNFPLEVKEFEAEEKEEVFKNYIIGPNDDFVRIGPKGYVLFKGYLKLAPEIYNFALRPDDIWVLSFPKSGTTWIQELVWMLANNCDYEGSAKVPLLDRYQFLERSMLFNNKHYKDLTEECMKSDDTERQKYAAFLRRSDVEICNKRPSPRFIKSHLPLSLLPPALLDTCKVVHVARDPRDVAVSYYHHLAHFRGQKIIEMKQLWNLLIKDLPLWTPFFENIKESWANRHHPNMLFLFYNELLKDLPSGVRRVAKLLGKTMTEDQISRLCDHLSFENFKNNKSVNGELLPQRNVTAGTLLVRKGKSGGWGKYFDEEMKQQAEKWMEDNLRDSDFKFPS